MIKPKGHCATPMDGTEKEATARRCRGSKELVKPRATGTYMYKRPWLLARLVGYSSTEL